MRPEHIRIQLPEKVFGHKNLLNAQLETISMLKRYDTFKDLRTEEMMLKILLKTKVEEALSELTLLEKLLPKPTVHPHPHHESSPEEPRIKKEKPSIESEIEEIRRKLSMLH